MGLLPLPVSVPWRHPVWDQLPLPAPELHYVVHPLQGLLVRSWVYK